MKKLFQLSFVPLSADFSLLLLRLWFGLTLFFNHGIGKLLHFSQWEMHFPDPIGVGVKTALILAVIAEVVCSACVVIGFATRFAAAVIFIELLIAFLRIHHATLAMGPGSGELPFLYMGAFLTIVFAGSGRYAVCKVTNIVEAPAATTQTV